MALDYVVLFGWRNGGRARGVVIMKKFGMYWQ